MDVYPALYSSSEAPMEKMYSMNDILDRDGSASCPKKGNIFLSMCHILYQVFRSLTTKGELVYTDNAYIQDAPKRESLDIKDSVHYSMFPKNESCTNTSFHNNRNKGLNYSYKYIETDNKDVNRSDRKESTDEKNVCNNTTNYNILARMENSNIPIKMKMLESSWLNAEEWYIIRNIYMSEGIHKSPKKEQFSDYIDNRMDYKAIVDLDPFSSSNSNIINVELLKNNSVSNMFINMWQNHIGSVANRFCRRNSIKSDVTMKRSFSPKQRRKMATVAKGRGRGRGRSQLRRSGVSQTRHRKDHTKHDLEKDIQNDLSSWLEPEMYDTVESNELEAVHPTAYTFADIKPKVEKPKNCKIANQGKSKYPARRRCIPECVEETNNSHQNCVENRYNSQKNTFRLRLVSESSIDSEDSYCIHFESSCEVNFTNDLEDSEESDAVETSEDDDTCNDEESICPSQKVKFNFNPTVHVMVHWDYAYRAARRGPWEEMARDRERFKGRINCIQRVLNSILTVQHRTHIWKERFACIE